MKKRIGVELKENVFISLRYIHAIQFKGIYNHNLWIYILSMNEIINRTNVVLCNRDPNVCYGLSAELCILQNSS